MFVYSASWRTTDGWMIPHANEVAFGGRVHVREFGVWTVRIDGREVEDNALNGAVALLYGLLS